MTDQTIEQQLANVLAAHREWVKTKGKTGVQLDLSSAFLTGADLTSANLTGA